MSQENVEVVKVAYEVFARGGLDRFMEHCTDDVEFHALAHELMTRAGPRQGRRAGMAPRLDRHVRWVLDGAG